MFVKQDTMEQFCILNYSFQPPEEKRITESITRQKIFVQTLKNFYEFVEIMMKTEKSHSGKRRKINQCEFHSIMLDVKYELLSLIKTINKPLCLRNLVKQQIYLREIKIFNLPKKLQIEMKNLSQDTLDEEFHLVKTINSKLKIIKQMYESAFSISYPNLTCTLI